MKTKDIVELVSMWVDIPVETLLSKNRKTELVRARVLMFALFKKMFPDMTLTEMARCTSFLVNRDTVSHALNTHQLWFTKKMEYRNMFNLVWMEIEKSFPEVMEDAVASNQKQIIIIVSTMFKMPYSKWVSDNKRSHLGNMAKTLALHMMAEQFPYDTHLQLCDRIGIRRNSNMVNFLFRNHEEFTRTEPVYRIATKKAKTMMEDFLHPKPMAIVPFQVCKPCVSHSFNPISR